MTDQAFLQGNRARWRLLKQLGEGDAGEVYLVESFLDKRIAILKRPRRGNFPADILRQANQIDTEGRILNALSYSRLSSPDSPVRIASLLDQSLPGNELTERFFIVVERAPGVPLSALLKLHRYAYQPTGLEESHLTENARRYLEVLQELRAIPELLVLRVLAGLFELLEVIHRQPVRGLNADHQGIVWNDTKLDHLFWDPAQARLYVIDWGNGQFLEADGVSADRRFSPADDYRQLVEVMGKFLLECTPQLLAPLSWPAYVTPADATPEGLIWLREKVNLLIHEKLKGLREARLNEVALIAANPAQAGEVENLVEIQRRIVSLGEIPDLSGAAHLYERLAGQLAGLDRWNDFQAICHRLEQMPVCNHVKWFLLSQIYAAADKVSDQPNECFRTALLAGLQEDWLACLWQICLATQQDAEPTRWKTLSDEIRRIALDPAVDAPSPYSAAVDLLHALEEDRPWIIDRLSQAIASGNLPDPQQPENLLKSFEALVARFKDETLTKWVQPNPVPPHSGLTYADVDEILAELADLLPRLGINPRERLAGISSALSQPRAQTEIVLDAWQAKGFKTAQQGLRNLLLWDPDRRRVLEVDQAIQAAPQWQEEARQGPQPGERLPDYALRMEFQCREMRSRVASAHWIESALILFADLRNGRRPGEVLAANPRLGDIFPWLRRYERKPAVIPKAEQAPPADVKTERRAGRHIPRESRLGQGEAVTLGEALDAWVPEAKGSSARVFHGTCKDGEARPRQAAIKIMRPDKVDYALPLFWEEAQILSILEDVPGVAQMIECGYFQFEGSQGLPSEDSALVPHHLTGNALRYGLDEVDLFVQEMEGKVSQGWLPYLALEMKNKEDCLLLHCDEGYTRGKYLPVDLGLEIAIKICDILEIAHARDIVYRDHKILHYYWNSRQRKVSTIDWNVAKWYPMGVSEEEIRLDMVQFGARTLHHILTGRPAPGALPVGPNRPQDIEMSPQRYAPAWTYDDYQRLPGEVMDILAHVLAGGYDSAARLREDLLIQIPYR